MHGDALRHAEGVRRAGATSIGRRGLWSHWGFSPKFGAQGARGGARVRVEGERCQGRRQLLRTDAEPPLL